MALYLVTTRQTVFEQTEVEASTEAEALELAFVNCSNLDWHTVDVADFEPINAIEITEG
jgi:hypothetical protein